MTNTPYDSPQGSERTSQLHSIAKVLKAERRRLASAKQILESCIASDSVGLMTDPNTPGRKHALTTAYRAVSECEANLGRLARSIRSYESPD